MVHLLPSMVTIVQNSMTSSASRLAAAPRIASEPRPVTSKYRLGTRASVSIAKHEGVLHPSVMSARIPPTPRAGAAALGRPGEPAPPSSLIDPAKLCAQYYDDAPDPTVDACCPAVPF